MTNITAHRLLNKAHLQSHEGLACFLHMDFERVHPVRVEHMIYKRLIQMVILTGGLALSARASATQFLFVIDGPYAISFAIDKQTSPETFTATSAFFNNVRSIVSGASGLAAVTLGDADVPTVSIAAMPGGNFQLAATDQFYSIVASRPRYYEGGYSVWGKLGAAVLTVREIDGVPVPVPPGPVTPIPEPATWLLMLAGLAAVGVCDRWRRGVTRSR